MEVFLGRTNQAGPNPNEVSRGVAQAVCHPLYDSSTVDNDMCLLKLSAPVTFTDYIYPVCLAAANSTVHTGTNSWVTGWGKADNGKSPPARHPIAARSGGLKALMFPVGIRCVSGHPPGGGGSRSGEQPVQVRLL